MDETKYHTRLEAVPQSGNWGEAVAPRVYAQVFRANFEAPGFALLSFEHSVSSERLRSVMWALKNSLGDLHRQATGKFLVALSAGRFDSQVTTKFHLDGAPDEAFLMLGYEATPVKSEISVADYSKAAHDWGVTPKELLARFNPMFEGNERRLMPYATRLSAFDPARSHILLLNNSSLPLAERSRSMLGVMHQATITPDSQALRVINSVMLSTAPGAEDEPVTAGEQKRFLETSEVTGRPSPE